MIEYTVDKNGQIIEVKEVEKSSEPTIEEKLEWIAQKPKGK